MPAAFHLLDALGQSTAAKASFLLQDHLASRNLASKVKGMVCVFRSNGIALI
jgi:hypothetical protein